MTKPIATWEGDVEILGLAAKSNAARILGAASASKAGKASAAKLTKAQRSARASKAASARWEKAAKD